MTTASSTPERPDSARVMKKGGAILATPVPASTAPRGSSNAAVEHAPARAPGWESLSWIGGTSAGLLVLLTVLHTAVFFVAGLPTSVAEWFTLFRHDPLLGLLAFELLMVAFAILSIPVALALFAALRRVEPGLAALYLALSVVSSVTFVLARPAFEMLALSRGFAAATTDVDRALYLAAGEATLARFSGTSFWTSYLLGSLSGFVLAAAMLKARLFGRALPALRVGSSVFDFGLLVPGVRLVLSLVSVLCLLAFNGLVARRLLRLAREAETPARHGGMAEGIRA